LVQPVSALAGFSRTALVFLCFPPGVGHVSFGLL
jgi:hypothetical protein